MAEPNDPPGSELNSHIAFFEGAQPVGNHARGTSLHETFHRFYDGGLSLNVQSAGRLIQNEDWSVLEKCARQRNSLTFTSGKKHAPFADLGLVSFRQTHDEVMRVGKLC